VLSGSGPFAIAPLHKVAVRIQFTPAVVGKADASLNITSSDPRRPTVPVALSGHGRASILGLPATVTFGKVGIGVTPGSTTFAVRNVGIGRLTGSVSTLATPFSVSAGAGTFNLAPGQKQPVIVQFMPAAVGHTSATLSITSDDPAHLSVNLPIGGTGVGGHLLVNLPPIPPALAPTLGFGKVSSVTTRTRTFTITNTARGVLNGSVGAFALGSPFSLSQGAGAFTLQPHQSLTIGVTFAPVATGRVTATLMITDTAPGIPALVEVAMTGRGT
jgi:hypothetical protein